MQAQADELARDLDYAKEQNLDLNEVYLDPALNFDEVSTSTCTTVLQLLASGIHPASPTSTATTTPQRVKTTRQINRVLTKRVHLAAERVCEAERLKDRIDEHLPTILSFLQAARRNISEQFGYPDGELAVMKSIGALYSVLGDIEGMLQSNTDLDATDEDSDPEFADRTRVNAAQSPRVVKSEHKWTSR
ncbi:hypothetical protein C8F04DRAFT_1116394 [Mycena alexandri]|uniref:Uncharacterized protein n=1 Tax=Mycena alexandri TaxID=1745969 RepID=A0AAD6SK25_9AGAR|nr:hypothetical protein C8F04DRAFT_1116394 [Mycena alexandri]